LPRIGRLAADQPILSEFPLEQRRSLIRGDLKAMVHQEVRELYDLRHDPGEMHDLLRPASPAQTGVGESTEGAALFGTMLKLSAENEVLEQSLNSAPTEQPLDEQTLEELKALGYIE
jgi:hypothetical protein